MKLFHKIFLGLCFYFISTSLFAQNNPKADILIKQGTALHDEGKYTEAIAKYKQALELEPANLSANYELGFTLYSSGNTKEAIPYLEKIINAKTTSLAAQAYDLLGSIYDDDKQPEKAIAYYKKGIAANPKYQRLYFNLSITYLRKGNDAEAERYAAEALKLDPLHSSSHRIYALATYNQHKRGASLLAWCNFLMIEPLTDRSTQAYQYVQNILNYGISKSDDKSVNIKINDQSAEGTILPLAVLSATADKKGLSAVDSLTLQLSSVFRISDNFQKQQTTDFYNKFYSGYFKKLAATNYMPTLARYISLVAYKDENEAWIKAHEDNFNELVSWVETNNREF
ncbi:tetratricopeptide repeat protein [Mucilaginibacter segetis]|uniref:Tetratricopeptide repeat protein n=1 Tax=Mucilaginibacter segetis TaxID=2793071 RepID=A0A934PS62_9SPHI|nr:tetratricopeptide repeat protein [Mucilaginibacter segetis]MBK0379803.1 tetratricopeptide repeat protein [Mucilaginibacter segetis]